MTNVPVPEQPTADDDARWLAFAEPLRAFLRRRVPTGVDVDDVAQEVFLRLARHRATMDDVDDLEAWIFRVARSALTDAYRAERRRAARASELDPDALAEEPERGEDARLELSRCVRPFIATLPPHYRRAIELTAVDGLTQEAAAQREGISLSGMKSRVQRARAMVRHEIQQCCGIQRDARGTVQGIGDDACAPPASFHQIQRPRK
ncbi:MAG: sigma-70 family RNA polymerase sigma factor [Gemmatimonadaceae bacterium]|nr:sigma-70 family RNA polymerase sigma factor [Gemmatimonadaceae bacterium]MCW5825684.1 sigma-70 family RNA polymerase sigma factor [Gemmatimonadaceae bacterium]